MQEAIQQLMEVVGAMSEADVAEGEDDDLRDRVQQIQGTQGAA